MYLYAIGTSENQQKIGFSKNPEKRLKTLQTGNANQLYLHYKFEINESTASKFESYVHRDLNHKHELGEWFSLTASEVISQMAFHEIMRETIEKSLKY